MSPTLFATYINDLSADVEGLDAGVKIGGEQMHMLMYADDIVLISPNHTKAQLQRECLSNWCKKWMMRISSKKSQIVQVRNYQEKNMPQIHCPVGGG